MPQRDIQSNILALASQTLTMDSTGDDDLGTGIDTKGARGGLFAIVALGATLSTQVSYLEILESDELSGTYTPVGAGDEAAGDKQLPTELNTEYESGQYGQLLVNPTSGYAQTIGFVGTKRYVKLRAHTDTSQGSVALTVVPILEMDERPVTQIWHPTIDGGDALP
jgi:hypothetical protein